MINAFMASRPFEMKRELVAIRGEEHLVLKPIKEIPSELELVTADAIHNLGQALDHLMCDLWRANGAHDVARKAYFPFCKSAESFPSRLNQMAQPLSLRDRDILASYKPYPGGNDLLYALHEMDVSDKHRELLAIGRAVHFFDGRLAVYPPNGELFSMRRAFLKAIEDGEPWVTFPAGSKVEYDIQISCDVAFKEIHGVKNHSVAAALREFRSIVQRIIVAFEKIYS